MRSKTATWFECKVRYRKLMDDGKERPVTELYVVDALTWTEAEQRITEEMGSYLSVEFTIQDIKKALYREVFFADDASADRWYRARLAFITVDEHSSKEKRSFVTYLVNAGSLGGALKAIDTVMGGTMIDYVSTLTAETQVLDVFEYKAKDIAPESPKGEGDDED